VETVIDYIIRVSGYGWWKVTMELVLIGLVVYWAVNFLEGTRGERLFRGVIFILVAVVIILKILAQQFAFDRLSYLYNGFLIFVLVIAVAAFQPEIRRALMRIGQPGFLINHTQQLAMTVEEIISAVMSMSASKTGAIIVVEKRVALGEFIDTGVKLDARVTSELLRTIFRPGTALHDMAVIIRGDRIAAARVQLPLAEAESMDGIELGSRHRAAIGISISSDATVVVVSEETGFISISEDGGLERNVSASDLRKHLSSKIDQMSGTVKKPGLFSKAQQKTEN